MAGRNDSTLLIEDAHLIYLNFTGKEGKYNREGDRNFCVRLQEDDAHRMEADGWNVKYSKPYGDDDSIRPYLPVAVRFKFMPPTIVLVTSKGRTPIGEDLCDQLDYVEIDKVDLIVRPYAWSVNGNSGIKAYLKSIYVTILEDYLALKYADVPLAITTGNGDYDDVIDIEGVEIYDEPAISPRRARNELER